MIIIKSHRPNLQQVSIIKGLICTAKELFCWHQLLDGVRGEASTLKIQLSSVVFHNRGVRFDDITAICFMLLRSLLAHTLDAAALYEKLKIHHR